MATNPSLTPSLTKQFNDIPRPPFRWGTRVALPVALILALGGVFVGSLASSLTSAVDVTAVPVVEKPSIKGAAQPKQSEGSTGEEVVVQAAGWIEPDPFPTFATALTGGIIEEIFFLEGDSVSKGQVLATMIRDDAELVLRRAEAEEKAAQEAWEANIEAPLRAQVAEAKVGEIEASIELTRAERDVEASLLEEANRKVTRRADLLKTESISLAEYEQVDSEAKAQAARIRVIEHRIDELKARLKQAQAERVASLKNSELRTEEQRRLELARVAVDEAKLRLNRLEIRSPIDGVVMRRFVEPGMLIMVDSDDRMMSQIAQLYNPEKLQIRVDVPLADAAKISVGQSARITVEVLSDQTFEGTVTRLTNFADISKNTLEVKVALLNPAPELKPEMLARVRFLAMRSDDSSTASSVSSTSVYTPKGSVSNDAAWVLSRFDGEYGFASRRGVSLTGAADGEWEEVSAGLNPGDLVITESATPLSDGLRLRLVQKGPE